MSLLMYKVTPEQVAVMTDTLATDTDLRAVFFTTKCVAMPHLRMAIAFTGVEQVGRRWASKVQSGIVAEDMDQLDRFAPEAMRETVAAVASEFEEPMITSTIYHFGYSPGLERCVARIYRETNDFTSELVVEDVFAIKPHPQGEFVSPGELGEWTSLAQEVQRQQEGLPTSERIGIGGELILCIVQKEYIHFQYGPAFPNRHMQWLEMNEQFQ